MINEKGVDKDYQWGNKKIKTWQLRCWNSYVFYNCIFSHETNSATNTTHCVWHRLQFDLFCISENYQLFNVSGAFCPSQIEERILNVDFTSGYYFSFVSLCRTRLYVQFLIFWPDKKISEMKLVSIKPKTEWKGK